MHVFGFPDQRHFVAVGARFAHPERTFGDVVFRWPLTYLAPPLLLVAFLVAAFRPRRRSAPMSGTGLELGHGSTLGGP